jgi:hypothetical protein
VLDGRILHHLANGPSCSQSVTALLDRLLHHAIVIQIEGSSYRLRQHGDLVPENIRSNTLVQPSTPNTPVKRRGRPPEKRRR